jgi:dihydroxyacid dehydratase/phosphogluconate dehydratase
MKAMAARGLMVGRAAPEDALGGPIAAVCEGDMIVFSASEGAIAPLR